MIETERLPISTNVPSSAHSSAFPSDYEFISRNAYLRSYGSPVFTGQLYYPPVFAHENYFSVCYPKSFYFLRPEKILPYPIFYPWKISSMQIFLGFCPSIRYVLCAFLTFRIR